MKIALYIEDGLEQIVLTAETETEKGILRKLHDDKRELSIKQGSFYECLGGYVRQSASFYRSLGSQYGESDDYSTMIVLRPKQEQTHDR